MTQAVGEAPTPPPAAVPFRGTGLAGRLWTTALVLLVAAAGLIVVYSVLALFDSWSALAAFAFAWFCGIVAIAFWAVAVAAAAADRGRLAGAVLALGAVVFLLVAVVSALSLRVTGEPGLVWSALVAAALGFVANSVAWLRGRRPSAGL